VGSLAVHGEEEVTPQAIRSFASRAAAHEGEDGRGPVHLDDGGRYYAVGVHVEDQVFVSPPDEAATRGG